MDKTKETILKSEIVGALGWDKLKHITADMLEGYTEIGSFAFYRCDNLTSVTIPDSVTRIEYGAFSNCDNLTSVTISNSITTIGDFAFKGCRSLASMTIPNSVTDICECLFMDCTNLTSVTIGDIEYKKYEITDGKCKAYKAFKTDMSCHGFLYEEGKTYEMDGEIKLCKRGFHACLNLPDVFNYYHGRIGKDIHIHEVELDGVSDSSKDDSKVVASKITIGKRIF